MRESAADPESVADAARIAAIDALLPQTQCERCGHPGCLPYARAIADGTAAINRCPPGGEVTIRALAQLLGVQYVALDPDLPTFDPRTVAVIDETRCIGCALCLPACPVDAIVGAAGYLHTVVRRDCTGCELCIPACPVDCIELATDSSRSAPAQLDRVRAAELRARFDAHTRRLAEAERAAESRRQARLARGPTKRTWHDA